VTLTEREKEPAKTIERETLGVIQSAGETLSPLPQVKTGPKEATETEKTPPQSEPAKPVVTETASETPELVEPLETAVSAETPEAVEPLTTEAPLETPEPVEPVAAEAPVETPESFEAVDEVPTLEDGVISLSEIEEVTEVEEIGEAEVEFAEEVEEEIEASSDIEPAAEFLEPLEEKVTEEEHAQHIPLSVPELSEDSFIEEPEEFLETELAEEVAVEEPESAASLKDEVEVAESAQISAQVEIEEAEAVEDDIGALQAINEGLEKTLPELEKLVQASYSGEVSEQTAEDTQSAQGKTVEEEDQPPTVPEEIFREKEGVARDDELSHLISSIEEGEAEPAEPKSRLQTVLEEFIENSKISKAAVLLRDEQGVFSPSALVGISDETRKKLNFEGSERIFKNILDRGKILYIKDDVFLNTQLKRKFHTTDAFEIVGLIFAPLFSSGTVKGIIVACTSVGESINTKILLDKIKKLIKNIIGIIS
jgi:hypothetical protein